METHKALGFVKYFWKYYPGALERLTTMAMIPPIFAAIWGRVLLLEVRKALRRLIRRRKAFARLRRIEAQRARTRSLTRSGENPSPSSGTETRPL